jgi:hypothetical protein
MLNTVVGLFRDPGEAERVIEELRSAGFEDDAINIVANAESCSVSAPETESHGTLVGKGVLTGAAVGGASLAALAIPGIGPVLALGPVAAGLLGAGLGGIGGGLLAELKQLGVPEEDAGCLCEAIRRGGTVVAVKATEQDAERAAAILGAHRLVDLDDCREDWAEVGWKGFDPAGEPVSTLATERQTAAQRRGLPFDPDSINPRARRERRMRRAVRRYVRVS